MKITTSNAPLAEEEKLCYDEKKRQTEDDSVDAVKQFLPKNNNRSGSFNSANTSNNENNIFCKTNNDNGNESERTKDGVASRTSSLYNRQRKFLTKLDQDEDLK